MSDTLAATGSDTRIDLFFSATGALAEAYGLINCTPVGMVGLECTPLPADAISGAIWAFYAVYTPVDTQFLKDAAAQGIDA